MARSKDNRYQVISGLEPGETIITAGLYGCLMGLRLFPVRGMVVENRVLLGFWFLVHSSFIHLTL